MFVCRLKRCFSLIVFTICVFSGSVHASETVPVTNLLREVINTNPEIKEALQVYEAVKNEVASARSGYKPRVVTDMSIGREVTDGVASNEEHRNMTASSAAVYARQNLYNGGGTGNLVNETKARMKSAAYEVLNVANKIFIGTVEAYLNTLMEYELLKLTQDNVNTQTEILEQIREKTESGFGRTSDLLNAQAKLALARANVISQQQNLKQATVKLHKSLGRFVNPEQLVAPKALYEFPESEEEVVKMAFSNYPALEVAKYNVLTRKYSMKRTESLYHPTLDAELRADYQNNTGGDVGDTKSYSAMLYLNYELYDGGRKKADKKMNYSQILKEHERTYIERRNLNEAVRLAWNIKTAEDRKHEFLFEHVSLTRDTLNAFKEEYELGRRTLLELLEMENSLQDAKKSLVESTYTAMSAHYRVLFVTGVLINEFETGIFEKVGLSSAKADFDMLEEYGDLPEDVDEDTRVDLFDQCDSTLRTTAADIFGCADREKVALGYTLPDDILPYIKPKNADSLDLAEGGLDEPEGLGEPEPAEETLSLGEPEPDETMQSLGGPEGEAPEPMAIDSTADMQSFNFDNILFELNSSRLKSSSNALLSSIADQLKSLGEYRLEIVGHTDSSGRASFNKELSAKRAETVYKKLVKMGVDPAKMEAYGKGESEPLHSNATRAGRVKNRRIEFKLTR